jgi:hypothetical protein
MLAVRLLLGGPYYRVVHLRAGPANAIGILTR